MEIPRKTAAGAISSRTKQTRDSLSLWGDGNGWATGDGSCSSSGSDHEALHSLVHAFFDCDVSDSHPPPDSDADEKSEEYRLDEAAQFVSEVILDYGDRFRLRLLSDVRDAADALAALRPTGSGFRRAVMARLRELGYNAGVCKVSWEGSGGLVPGNYEYVDVVAAEEAEKAEEVRYLVDLSFAAEFRVARASEKYEQLVSRLPEVMVARPEMVRRVVRTVGDAARRSLRQQGMPVPPWRKGRYMMSKWLGSYRRTVNAVPASAGASASGGGGAKCRTVGFTAAVNSTTRVKF
ncbi:uncharacterized protein LOC122017420 [Zingiber officinale]|uniref:DUF506 family protein n=1 Tax=Zingiber officinale TaxID=94328 RepID=A0A8J5F8X3_ZINOF|nr:uncharacterized protein LOC122017420 [Zingiber officinale]KAG6481888.1 hypothetical protein ZIOFF_058511 [Zingiber officinale]